VKNSNGASIRSYSKLKSFLPKVLLQDNIGLDADLLKAKHHLQLEKKRAVSNWRQNQKIFITQQALKEVKSGLILLSRHVSPTKFPKLIDSHRAQGSGNNHCSMTSRAAGQLKHTRRTINDARFMALESTLLGSQGLCPQILHCVENKKHCATKKLAAK